MKPVWGTVTVRKQVNGRRHVQECRVLVVGTDRGRYRVLWFQRGLKKFVAGHHYWIDAAHVDVTTESPTSFCHSCHKGKEDDGKPRHWWCEANANAWVAKRAHGRREEQDALSEWGTRQELDHIQGLLCSHQRPRPRIEALRAYLRTTIARKRDGCALGDIDADRCIAYARRQLGIIIDSYPGTADQPLPPR